MIQDDYLRLQKKLPTTPPPPKGFVDLRYSADLGSLALVDETGTEAPVSGSSVSAGVPVNAVLAVSAQSTVSFTNLPNNGVSATPGRLGSKKIDENYEYTVCKVTDGVPLWKKTALQNL